MKEQALQDALLEIGAEEIPASYCVPALEHMKAFAEDYLRSQRLDFKSVETYGTPRRLALHIAGLPAKSQAQTEQVWGPSAKAAKDADGAWTQAAKGFAQAHGKTVEDLRVEENPAKKGPYLCLLKQHAGLKTETLLAALFSELIPTIPSPKKMVWNAARFKFARPIRNLVALYGHAALKVSVAGLKATNKTFALSHLSSQKIAISSPHAYVTALKNHCILADPRARRETILHSASQLAKRVGGELKVDEALLDEVVWLVEHPVAVLGSIQPEFLSLPKEVLITCMKKHQKYFTILDGKDRLLPHFIAVRNGISEHQDIVRKGYEKVLNARLTDAKFFFEQDLKKPLSAYVEKCGSILLQEKLGSVNDKIDRMKAVAQFVLEQVRDSRAAEAGSNGHADPAAVERAIQLSKFDLATGMVYEFPELQGTMGGLYAERYGENPKVAEAVREHYFPVSVQGELPGSPEAAVVSLADKVDGLIGNFIIGRVPSGSSDPYGLRRQAAGILRIMLQKGWDFPIRALLEKAVAQYGAKAGTPESVVRDALNFLADRFQRLTEDNGLEADEIQAAVRNPGQADAQGLRPGTLQKKIAALHEVRRHPDFEAVAGAYKRASNILKQARTKQLSFASDRLDQALFKEEAEKDLHSTFNEISGRTRELISRSAYREALQEWVKLRPALDHFFEKVMVMDPDPAVCSNRLSLLASLESLFREIAEFSHLQNKSLS